MITLGCYRALFAQPEIESKTKALFDTPVKWMKNYTGYIDDVHEVTLCLAFDGFNCCGYMQYSSSETEYLLEGSLQSSKFSFLEKYQNAPSGYLAGTLLGETITLEWNAIDELTSFSGVFSLANAQYLSAPNPITVFSYTGTLDMQSVSLRLTRQSTGLVGEMMFADGTAQQIRGTQSADNSWNLENVSAGYNFRLINTKGDSYEANYILPGDEHAADLTMSLLGQVNARSTAYLSHHTMIKCLLPSFQADFDQLIDRMVDDWTLDIERNKDKIASNRFAQRADIWFEINEYSDAYLSGILYYSSSWKKDVSSKSFSYDRASKDMVSVSPFLKGSSKWENIVREKLIAAKKMNETQDQVPYEKWINKVTLIEPMLCANGLRFHTEKSSVFGQASIMLPWTALTPTFLTPSKLTKLKKRK